MKRLIPKLTTLLAIAGVWAGASINSHASYSWQLIENNQPAPNIAGQITLSTTYVPASASVGPKIGFRLQNIGLIESSITQVAFDTSGLVSEPMTIVSGPGTDYVQMKKGWIGGSPFGFNTVQFVIDIGAQPDSKGEDETGVAPNGINADASGTEYVDLFFNVANQDAYNNIVNQIGDSFRVGVHVQSLPGDASDAYLTVIDDKTPTPVPEPATMLAAALLLLPFGASAIRILRRKNQ